MSVSATGIVDSTPPITIGANFQGLDDVTFGLASIPDTDGAVGPDRFVEFINGRYQAYDHTGAVLQSMALDQFWIEAGVAPAVFAFDPRVLFDPTSGRWFASASDSETVPGNVLFAVSKTSDPTQGWQAFAIPASATGDSWADFPTLGVNANGVYLSFAASDGAQPVIAMPKADLLQATPSIANATSFYFSGALERNAFPAVGFDSSGSELLAVVDSSFVQTASVDGAITSPVLNTNDRTFVLPDGVPFGGPPPAVQKGTATGLYIRLGDQFTSSVVLQDGKLFGVRTINDGNHAAVQWLEIGDPLTAPTLLGSGVIHPVDLDVFNPSIAVNPLGEAVIGFTGSGPNEFASAYAVAGTLNGDALQFGDPILLKAGEGPFDDPQVPTPAWGDYSATTYDPENPSHFWTIQERAALPIDGNGLHWADQISEIIFPSAAPTVQTWFGNTGDFGDPNNWTPPGSPLETDTLIIDAGRAQADSLTINNPTIQLGSPGSSPTLVLQDSILGVANAIKLETTRFDPAAPDIRGRIKVMGAVTDNGTIDVGAAGADVHQLFPAHLTLNIARDSSFTLTPTGIWSSSNGSTIDVSARGKHTTFANNGTIEAVGGTVTLNAAVSGHGVFDVLANSGAIRGGTVEFRQSVARGEIVRLENGMLVLDAPMRFLGEIEQFNPASRIELRDTKATRADYDNGVLKLFDQHRLVAALDLVGNFTSDQFQLSRKGDNTFVALAASGAQADPAAAPPTHWLSMEKFAS
jgi:hypothetical protein